jgi:hypothetical protein
MLANRGHGPLLQGSRSWAKPETSGLPADDQRTPSPAMASAVNTESL